MAHLTPEGATLVAEIAARHGVSVNAVETLLVAVANGRGRQAQFNVPELGGMGQWSAGGMTMVGDMFNHGLKATVDALCTELSGVLADSRIFSARSASSQSQSSSGVSLFVPGTGIGEGWWPSDLGTPSSTGTQNDMRYAVFPETQRLVIKVAGRTEVYDTGDHLISGVSQQQSGDQSLTFVSQLGLVRVSDLPKAEPATAKGENPDAAASIDVPPTESASEADAPNPVRPPVMSKPEDRPDLHRQSADTIIALIKQLAELKDSGILSEAEFDAKKTELLSRL